MGRKKKDKKQFMTQLFSLLIVFMFFGSVVAGALFFAPQQNSNGPTLAEVFGNQKLSRFNVPDDLENSLIGVGIVFVETGNDAMYDSIENIVLPNFPSVFPIGTAEDEVTDFYSVYLIKDDAYNGSVNIRTMLEDKTFESLNNTEVMDFICDGLNPRYSIYNDYWEGCHVDVDDEITHFRTIRAV